MQRPNDEGLHISGQAVQTFSPGGREPMQGSAQGRDTDLCLERSLWGWCGGWTGEGETGAGALQWWLSQGRGRGGGGVRPNGCLRERKFNEGGGVRRGRPAPLAAGAQGDSSLSVSPRGWPRLTRCLVDLGPGIPWPNPDGSGYCLVCSQAKSHQ